MSLLLATHVAISLVAIAAGIVVLRQWTVFEDDPRWASAFIVTTALTSAGGFLLPADRVLPSHVFGVITLCALALTLVARYVQQMLGPWRRVYVVTVALSFYLNVVVLIVQSFQNIPLLHQLAPTQTEAPFLVIQLGALAAVAAVTIRALRGRRVMV